MDLIQSKKNENSDTQLNTQWIERLAIEEVNTEESGVINFNEHLNPTRLLEESSLNLMEELKQYFEIFVGKFNELRGTTNTSAIKIFKISNTVNDFMLFRNSLKLVVARRSHDVISIGFLSNSGGLFSARLNNNQPASNNIHEIRAHVGPFNDISWTFQGEKINLQSLIKHYLTEFVKHSAR
jgi:hypothetical protein